MITIMWSLSLRGFVVVLFAPFWVACASGGPNSDLTSGGGEIQIDRIPTATTPIDLRTEEEIAVVTNTVGLPMSEAWALLPSVYAQLALPVTFTNDNSHIVGAREIGARRKLGDERLSTYLNCGSGARGNRADRYAVTLTVMTQVLAREASDSTVVATHVDASARTSGVGGATRIRCSTTGRLEAAVVARLRACDIDPATGEGVCLWGAASEGSRDWPDWSLTAAHRGRGGAMKGPSVVPAAALYRTARCMGMEDAVKTP